MVPGTEEKIRELLIQIKSGSVKIEDGVRCLRNLPFEDMGFARVDHHRHLRTGFPEVIFCEGKTERQVEKIAQKIISSGNDLLATRASIKIVKHIKNRFPNITYHEQARCLTLEQRKKQRTKGEILVICAGTSDIPVAEEVAITAGIMGSIVKKLYDVGVSGLHRLLMDTESLYSATVIVVVAGMEGALASVVGGLVDKPVISVPTSVGYGSSFGGISALLTMLNSCTAGIGVVNIDNGFGAGHLAHTINRLSGYRSSENQD